MTKKYKMLILDLDGTTVAAKPEALPSQTVIQAVGKAQEWVHVALATGRSFGMSRAIIEKLGLKGPSVFSGGAYIINTGNGKPVHSELLPAEVLRELAEIALRFHHHVFTADIEPGKPVNDPHEIIKPAAMLVVEGVNDNQIKDIFDEVAAVNGVVAHTANSWSGEHLADIHITSESASKRHGVERLIDLMKLKKKEVIAIGDSHNDLPLLQAAGFKVAMGGAPEQLKAAADYVAPPFEADGAAEAITRFILADRE